MQMNYEGLVKRLRRPRGFAPPVELTYDDIRAHAISRTDLDDDVHGINASLELIRRTRGGRWPAEPVTPEYDYVDLVWHELEFREGDSLTYAVHGAGHYIGCAYFYPLGRRAELTEELMAHDVDVSWWVTPDAYEASYYVKLYAALRHWMTDVFGFWSAHYSNVEIPVSPATTEPPLSEYTVRRTIAAPRPRVFEAFTDPHLFAHWFVVPGYSTPADRVVVDPRRGGGVQAVMVSEEDGSEVPFSMFYDDFDPPARVTIGISDHTERLTVTLTDTASGRTQVKYHATSQPPAGIPEARQITEDQLDRLAAALAKETHPSDG